MTEENVKLDETPTGEEEEEAFSEPDGFERLKIKSLGQDIRERKIFAERAYGITQSWIGFLIVLTLAQFSLRKFGCGLSELEFNIVFTTTTGSVLVFWWLVGKYLFNHKR